MGIKGFFIKQLRKLKSESGKTQWYTWPFDLGIGDEPDIKTKSTMTPEQEELMSGLGAYLQSRIGKGATPYPSQLTADMSVGEQSAYAKALENLYGGVGQTGKASLAAYLDTLKGGNEKDIIDRYMKYQAPLEYKYLTKTQIPTFKESMVPGGTLRSTGTERGIADIINTYGLGQLSRIGEAIEAGKNRATSALSYAPGMASLEKQTTDVGQVAEMGGIARTVKQAELLAKYQEFIRTQPENSQLLQTMLGYLGLSPFAAYTSTPTSLMDLIAGIAPAVGAVAGAAL